MPSQSRRLPDRADLQGRHEPVLHLELDNPSQAAALSRRPIYMRSSTLAKYDSGEWRRVGQGRRPEWLLDAGDGREDGKVTLAPAFPDAELPGRSGLPGVCPRFRRVPGY